jgi:serine/threonine protein kinase
MMEIRKLTPGDRILDYRILESIGEGGFGEVFRAEHEVLGRVVAIKVPRDLEALSALRMEGVIQAQLDHPGIVKTLEMSISHDPPYVAMEYIEGDSLRRLLERGALPWKRSVKLLIDVCKALEYAHSQGIIHGDIKPGNILISAKSSESAKLTDFGLGRALEGCAHAKLQISRSLNFVESASKVVGTLRYLAPELQRGETADALADVYSIGVLLFEMLTGGLPEGREVPSDVKRGIPASLDELFGRCFVRKNRRIKSTKAILEELQFILDNNGISKADKEKNKADKEKNKAAKALAKKSKTVSNKAAVIALNAPEREAPKMDKPALIDPLQSVAPSPSEEAPAFSFNKELFPDFECYQERLWSSVRDELLLPEGIEEIDARGFDMAFGVLNDGDPQHRIFACALPEFDGESARQFVTHGSRVFDLEKGLWEKEVTFIIATQNVIEKEKVDWALRSFSTGWWRRRRVILYDLSQDRLVTRDYGCDPADNELKKIFVQQMQDCNQEIIEDRERWLAFDDVCRLRSSRIGTALTVFSTFCVIAVGLSFQGGKIISTKDRKAVDKDRPMAEMRAVCETGDFEEVEVKKKRYKVKLPIRNVENQ